MQEVNDESVVGQMARVNMFYYEKKGWRKLNQTADDDNIIFLDNN